MVIIWRKGIRENGYIHECGDGDAGIDCQMRIRLKGFYDSSGYWNFFGGKIVKNEWRMMKEVLTVTN